MREYGRSISLAVLAITACAEGEPERLEGEGVAVQGVVTPGQRPRPLLNFDQDIRYTNGTQIINHAYIQPTRATYDGRIAFEAENPGGAVNYCFRVLRPEVLTSHISLPSGPPGTPAVELAEPKAERWCLPTATFHSAAPGGSTGAQVALCDAKPTQAPGRVDPLDPNADPQPCAANPANDCYHVTSIIHVDYPSNAELWARRFVITVANPKTPLANIVDVQPDGPAFGTALTTGMLEPVMSADGRLLIWHNGRTVSYLVNPKEASGEVHGACDPRGFRQPSLSISHAYHERTGAMAPYGFAKFQLRDYKGDLIPDNAEVGGAYPWIDRNGNNLFVTAGSASLYYQNAAGTIQPRYPVVGLVNPAGGSPNPPANLTEIRAIGDIGNRNGVIVMGLWTQGKMVTLDSRINNSDLAMLDYADQRHDRYMDFYAGTPGGTHIGASNITFINSVENVWNYDPDIRPVTPRDVVWQVSATTGTDEIAFDDFLLKRALVISHMNPPVWNTAPSLTDRDYVDGFDNTAQFKGEGFIETPLVQNAAAGTYWKLPASGELLGGARVEPIAAGGVKAKGIHLDGSDDQIRYVVPAQTAGAKTTDLANSAWMYSLWLNPTTPLDATQRRILQTPDGTVVNLTAARILIRKGASTADIVIPVPLRLGVSRYSHLAFVEKPAGADTAVSVYLDGFLLTSVTMTGAVLRMATGAAAPLLVGTVAGQPGVAAWVDEFKVIAQAPNAEEVCNHAYGTLVGVTAGPGFDRAGQYPIGHAEIKAATGASYDRYYCESHFVGGADGASSFACKFSRTDPRCVGKRIEFPEGPLHYNLPRPASQANAFCLTCHDAGHPSPTMQLGALTLTPGVTAEHDRRRQPMQTVRRLFGALPANLFGPGKPSSGLNGTAAGHAIDPYLLP